MKANASRIRRTRIEAGHGLNSFARKVGLSSPGLSRIENGQRQPRPETLKKIADGLGLTIADLMDVSA